jgi:hypothetical protein
LWGETKVPTLARLQPNRGANGSARQVEIDRLMRKEIAEPRVLCWQMENRSARSARTLARGGAPTGESRKTKPSTLTDAKPDGGAGEEP